MREPVHNRLLALLLQAGGSLRVRSVLNPVLWLAGMCLVGYAVVAVSTGREPPPVLTWILGGSVGVAVFSCVYLLGVDPDKLQSEEYQLRKQMIALVRDKGSRKTIEVAVTQMRTQDEARAGRRPKGDES